MPRQSRSTRRGKNWRSCAMPKDRFTSPFCLRPQVSALLRLQSTAIRHRWNVSARSVQRLPWRSTDCRCRRLSAPRGHWRSPSQHPGNRHTKTGLPRFFFPTPLSLIAQTRGFPPHRHSLMRPASALWPVHPTTSGRAPPRLKTRAIKLRGRSVAAKRSNSRCREPPKRGRSKAQIWEKEEAGETSRWHREGFLPRWTTRRVELLSAKGKRLQMAMHKGVSSPT
jgi:hypothetical protein